MNHFKEIEVPKTFAADGLIQLHWQNCSDRNETVMVAQGGGFETVGYMQEWIQEVLSRRGIECTEGWQPMICDSTSKYFVRSALTA